MRRAAPVVLACLAGGLTVTGRAFATPVTATSPTSEPAATGMPAAGPGASPLNEPAASVTTVTVTGISPNNGPVGGGTRVTISGNGFVAGSTVRFGSVPATVLSVHSSESMTVASPRGGTTEVVDVTVSNRNGSSAQVAKGQFAYDSAPAGPWLGLDGNSVSNPANQNWLGPVNEFSKQGIAYDRSFELTAGQLPSQVEKTSGRSPSEFEDRLKYDYEYGMVPVSVVEYGGYDRKGFRFVSDPEFPQSRSPAEERQGRNTISGYVSAFVRSAVAIRRLIAQRYPGMQVLFEPMNEPWGYTTPQHNAAEYANVIAQLLPAAKAAGIPLNQIYVAATGKDCARNGECVTNGWVSNMYAAQPKLQSEIQGWYFHPYGPASGVEEDDDAGIQSLPLVQATMTSGQNNIIISEVGYCAGDINQGGECPGSGESSAQAAEHLTEMLANARPYREAGWMRALMVYARGAGGWAMQSFPSKKLTKQGTALLAFAQRYGQTRSLLAEVDPAAYGLIAPATYSADGAPGGLWGALTEAGAFTR